MREGSSGCVFIQIVAVHVRNYECICRFNALAGWNNVFKIKGSNYNKH